MVRLCDPRGSRDPRFRPCESGRWQGRPSGVDRARGLGFLLSIDEVATIHERWGDIARNAALIRRTGLFLGSRWTRPGGFVLVLYLPFLIRLDARTRWLLIAAGAVFVAGAVGLEIVNGTIELADPDGDRVLLWSLLTGVEEFLEFIGASLLVYALMDALAGPTGMVTIVVDRKEHTAP